MKKILMALAAAACVLSGCSEDNTQEDIIIEDVIELSAESLSAGPEGAENLSVTVTSSSDWRLAGHCDWAEPSTVAGKSGDAVLFTVMPNESESRREATFKFFTGAAVIPFKIVSEPEYRLELLSATEQTFETAASSFGVRFDTNLPEEELTIEVLPEDADDEQSDSETPWIVYEEMRSGYGVTILDFAVAENQGYLPRAAKIRVSGLDKTAEIAVRQKMVELLEADCEASYAFDLEAATFSVDIRTSIDYAVILDKKCADWVTYTTTLVSEVKGLRTERIDFSVAAARTSRSGKISIGKNSGGWSSDIIAEFAVAQKDPNAVVVEIPDENFVKWLVNEGWIEEDGEDSGIYVATETGLTATELVFNPSRSRDAAKSIEGIAYFPALTKIDVSDNDLSAIDLTGLKHVTSLVCFDNSNLSRIDLGDNPIREFAVFTDDASDGSIWNFSEMTISGSQLETLNIAVFDRSNVRYDDLETLDLSGCPSLQTLDCRRGTSFTTLILKQGQNIPNLQKLDTTEIVYK